MCVQLAAVRYRLLRSCGDRLRSPRFRSPFESPLSPACDFSSASSRYASTSKSFPSPITKSLQPRKTPAKPIGHIYQRSRGRESVSLHTQCRSAPQKSSISLLQGAAARERTYRRKSLDENSRTPKTKFSREKNKTNTNSIPRGGGVTRQNLPAAAPAPGACRCSSAGHGHRRLVRCPPDTDLSLRVECTLTF